jgi:uncharacterized membrane protein
MSNTITKYAIECDTPERYKKDHPDVERVYYITTDGMLNDWTDIKYAHLYISEAVALANYKYISQRCGWTNGKIIPVQVTIEVKHD